MATRGGYWIGRREIIAWLNDLLEMDPQIQV
jgi:hypothetical protein